MIRVWLRAPQSSTFALTGAYFAGEENENLRGAPGRWVRLH